MLEKAEWAIKNGQSRGTGSIWAQDTEQRKKKQHIKLKR